MRAAGLGLPLFLGILGGTPEHWGKYGRAYRNAWSRAGHAPADADIAVAVHGFVGEDKRAAKASYLEHEIRMFQTGSAEIGLPAQAPPGRAADLERGKMVFAGDPDEVAERILQLHERLGHTGQILQMDVDGSPQISFLKSIELLGTKVLPAIRRELEKRVVPTSS